MEAEFVNMFVQKQKDALVDTLMKNIMLETRLAIAETKLQSLSEVETQYQTAQKTADDYNNRLTQLQQQLKEQQQQIMTLKKTIADLTLK